MSVLGTGVAAGVAQTGLAAQQQARQRDRAESQSARDARRVHDIVEAHLRAVEEGDEPESPGKLVIGGDVPEHQRGTPQRDGKRKNSRQPAPDSAVKPTPENPAIKHVDLRA